MVKDLLLYEEDDEFTREIRRGHWNSTSSDSLSSIQCVPPLNPFSTFKEDMREARPFVFFKKILGDGPIAHWGSLFPNMNFSEARVMIYFGMRALMHARVNSYEKMVNVGELVLQLSRLHAQIASRASMVSTAFASIGFSVDGFREAMRLLLITPDMMANSITSTTMSLLSIGEFINMDTSVAPSAAKSLLTQPKSISKPRMIPQVGTRLANTNLPIIIGTIVYEDVSESDLCDKVLKWWTEHASITDKEYVICFGKHSNSERFRIYCSDHSLPYISELGRQSLINYPKVFTSTQMPIDSWASYYRPATKDSIIYLNGCEADSSGQYLMGNVFRTSSLDNDGLPFAHSSKLVLHTCAEFNSNYGKLSWPYELDSIMYTFDCIFFTTILHNCYHMWLSASPENAMEKPTEAEFYEVLGWELIEAYTCE